MPALIETSLHSHPEQPCATLENLLVSASFGEEGSLRLRYRLTGEMTRLQLPAAQAPGPADGLWQHTCCEAFIAAVDARDYREFNFSPAGQWASYRFADYRKPDAQFSPPAVPQLDFRQTATHCELLAILPATLLPDGPLLQIGLSAVIEGVDGTKSYWALKHPAPQPDFHLRAGFALTLNQP